MSLRVLHPGFQTLLQDWGRYGHQHVGITTGGPMDEHAYLWGNRLLGNDPRAPALEITFGQLRIRAEHTTQIALTGANMDARVGQRLLANWSTHTLFAGDELQLLSPRSGITAYLAVRAGFDVRLTMGSCSTVAREGLGGLSGRGAPLKANDLLPCREGRVVSGRQVPPEFIPDYSAPVHLRLLPGYQSDDLPAADLERFFASAYRVTKDSNRMGFRLSGPPIQPDRTNLISEGICMGSVQLPPDGQPIVLLRDHQTIGGYPKIGSIALLDCSKLAQLRAGSTVRFTPADLDAIAAERLEFETFFGLHDKAQP